MDCIVLFGLLEGTYSLLSAWTAGCHISQFPLQRSVVMFRSLFLICILIESKKDKWISLYSTFCPDLIGTFDCFQCFHKSRAVLCLSPTLPSCRHRRTDVNNLTAGSRPVDPYGFTGTDQDY